MSLATSLVQRLVILKDSSLDDRGLRAYLAQVASTLSVEEIEAVASYTEEMSGDGELMVSRDATTPSTAAGKDTAGPLGSLVHTPEKAASEKNNACVAVGGGGSGVRLNLDKDTLDSEKYDDSIINSYSTAMSTEEVIHSATASTTASSVISMFRSNRSKRKNID